MAAPTRLAEAALPTCAPASSGPSWRDRGRRMASGASKEAPVSRRPCSEPGREVFDIDIRPG